MTMPAQPMPPTEEQQPPQPPPTEPDDNADVPPPSGPEKEIAGISLPPQPPQPQPPQPSAAYVNTGHAPNSNSGH